MHVFFGTGDSYKILIFANGQVLMLTKSQFDELLKIIQETEAFHD